MIGFTSINHMGYVALAIAAVATLGSGGDAAGRATALNGAVMQMLAHGLSTGALFCLAAMLAERSGSYRIGAVTGLRSQAPVLAGVMGVALFANLGLPGLAGFVGEFLIFRGAWASLGSFALVATVGLVVTALALLRMYGTIFNGRASSDRVPVADLPLSGGEFLSVAPLLILLIFLGLYPTPVLDVANQAASALAQLFTRALL
jgi:NADH-quinone oxidoreductase subunit M